MQLANQMLGSKHFARNLLKVKHNLYELVINTHVITMVAVRVHWYKTLFVH